MKGPAVYIDKQVAKIAKELEAYAALQKKERQKYLMYAAIPFVEAAQRLAPVGVKIHYRYDGGRRVAKYLPGNLRGAVQVLRFRRSESVFVGPKVSKSGKGGGTFGGRRFDAYYAHFVEFGTKNRRARPFMRPAYAVAAPAVRKRIELALKQIHKKFTAKIN